MPRVSAALTFPGTVHEAEACWYDVQRWPAWVDGLDRVVQIAGNWPQPGASVEWVSGPAGRGRVVERVVGYEPLAGQSLEVQDDSIDGRQQVTFTPADAGVEVQLSLDYVIRQRSMFTPVVDFLFIRRAMTNSLVSTLERFGAELAAARAGEER